MGQQILFGLCWGRVQLPHRGVRTVGHGFEEPDHPVQHPLGLIGLIDVRQISQVQFEGGGIESGYRLHAQGIVRGVLAVTPDEPQTVRLCEQTARVEWRVLDHGRGVEERPGADQPLDVGLPAYRGGDSPVAGMKWIASFPGNVAAGLERASASITLNSLVTGQPSAFIEGSVISAKRTAASAALAARVHTEQDPPAGVVLIGCGVINLEILRFLAAALPGLREAVLYDTDPARAEAFARTCAPHVVRGSTWCTPRSVSACSTSRSPSS
ncbi:ornithine cyclodeaminase/mu-crystallin family protein [Streptomyces sp. CEV 2-1]|nr:ornithine cyclodeaminase/mu-crystallin family protein [Streptomyces sp. CEV 2-1]